MLLFQLFQLHLHHFLLLLLGELGEQESELQPHTPRRSPRRIDRFAKYTVSELAGWSDYDLEVVGRLAEPLSYNPATDKYEPISWEDAFPLVGSTLRALESPHQASFYTSGRLSNGLTAAFLFALIYAQ